MAGKHGDPDKPTDANPGSDRDGQRPGAGHGSGEPMPEQGGDGTRPGQ